MLKVVGRVEYADSFGNLEIDTFCEDFIESQTDQGGWLIDCAIKACQSESLDIVDGSQGSVAAPKTAAVLCPKQEEKGWKLTESMGLGATILLALMFLVIGFVLNGKMIE